MCADLEAELAVKHTELDSSNTTILSLLDSGISELPALIPAPVQLPAHSLRTSHATSLRSSDGGRPVDIFVSST